MSDFQSFGFLALTGGTLTGNGAASTPELKLNGTWFSGGTTTTTKPMLLIEPSGTTSANWSTSGTGFGINAASGFSGNLFDLQVGGVDQFFVDASGFIHLSPSNVNNAGRVIGPDGNSYIGFGNQELQFAPNGGILFKVNTQGPLCWAMLQFGAQFGSTDAAINRVSAGLLEVNTGSAGVLAQLSLQSIKANTKAGAPTTTDVPAGTFMLWRDTSGSTTKFYYNNAGTLQSVALA